MKMITGLIEPTTGKILFRGEPIDRDWTTYKQTLGYVPEEQHLYSHLTGGEHLEMVAQLRGLPAKTAAERIAGLLRLFGLAGERHVPISSYSKGMRQKTLLSAALMHNPELILLDEPFSGLDVGSGLVLRSLIEELAARGKVVLFSSHELETVERVCSRVVILHRGMIVADDSIELATNADGAAHRSKISFPSLPWSRIPRRSRARSPISFRHEFVENREDPVSRAVSRVSLSHDRFRGALGAW